MSAPVLLVFDYPGRRPEARVSDLRLADAGYDVRQLMTPPLPRAASAAAYARQALDAAARSLGEVHAVLGYCMAAPLAQEAAVLTGCPRVLLFDGEPSTPQAVEVEYRKLLISVGASAALPSWWDSALLREPSQRFLGHAERHLTQTIRRSMAEQAEPGEDGEEDGDEELAPLVDGFLDWLAYLVAAYRTGHPAWGGSVVNFLSRQQPEISAWPGARSTRSVRVDTAREDLLTDATTRRHVLETLSGPRPAHAHPEEGAQ
ncbi:hypothetical protein AB0K92_08550 [Streptomyces sp. NPDC052687]|uniref:hypothetical protein n=1 Tax=Streptomyces sp. NPDC052687 TaxID=3154759 RepID=UPI00342FE727